MVYLHCDSYGVPPMAKLTEFVLLLLLLLPPLTPVLLHDYGHTAAAEAEAVEQKAAAPRKPTLLSQPAPETYAIIEISGKQMFVEPGKWYVTNRLKVRTQVTLRDCLHWVSAVWAGIGEQQ